MTKDNLALAFQSLLAWMVHEGKIQEVQGQGGLAEKSKWPLARAGSKNMAQGKTVKIVLTGRG